MKSIEELEKENALLRKKLEVAKFWMSQEVEHQMQNISTSNKKENIKEIIEDKIENFFEDIVLINLPTSVIQNIITSEINYHHMAQGEAIWGSSVIIGYHKAIDILIEKNITKTFRKFAKKHWYDELERNDPLEKTLHRVVNEGHSMSIGRLYHLISMITKGEHLENYSRWFAAYLEKYTAAREILLSTSFWDKLGKLMDTEVLWKKRHIWMVKPEETKKVRDLLIGDFQDKDCIIYDLIEITKMEF